MKSFKLSCFIIFVVFAQVSLANESQNRHIEYPTYFTHANGVRIAYQDFGATGAPTLLLVMGLGGQLIHWNDQLVLALVDKGYRVIRFDNRDVGLSQKLHDAPKPGVFTLLKYKLGLPLGAPYKLDDMAADGIGLLDNLGIQSAHVVGVSMGGMIAQIMAAKYPKRISSLTSIMSTSGDPDLPPGEITPDLDDRAGTSREELVASNAQIIKAISANTSGLSEEEFHARAVRGHDRMHYEAGYTRQIWAIADSGDRVELLKTITQPTVVIHGKQDPLIPIAAAEQTAELVDNSKLVLIDNMGHYINDQDIPKIVHEIAEISRR